MQRGSMTTSEREPPVVKGNSRPMADFLNSLRFCLYLIAYECGYLYRTLGVECRCPPIQDRFEALGASYQEMRQSAGDAASAP